MSKVLDDRSPPTEENAMCEREPLVSRAGLESLVDHIGDAKPHEEYLKRRWIGMVMWWHQRAVEARWKYFGLRALVVVGGILLPVLAALSARADLQPFMIPAIAITGAVVAGCTAWEGIAQYGDTWRDKRRASELLKVEGWLFLHRCGKYAKQSHAAAFPLFVCEVEAMIAREVGDYLGLFEPSIAEGKKAAQTILDAIAEQAAEIVRGKGPPQKPP